MPDVSEIDKAEAAHSIWNTRLRNNIFSGKLDVPVDTIRLDNECFFGRWLYGDSMTARDKSSEYYRVVKILHAHFHRTAAEVAALAIRGRQLEVEASMREGGEYANASAKLSQAIAAWKHNLKEKPLPRRYSEVP
jgi:hypothetical protein